MLFRSTTTAAFRFGALFYRLLCLIPIFILTAFLSTATAQPNQTKTGKPWLDMDYGPFLTATIEAPAPRTNLAYKGSRLMSARLLAAITTKRLFSTPICCVTPPAGPAISWRSKGSCMTAPIGTIPESTATKFSVIP